MAQTTDRLRRYLSDELGECRDDDLQERIDELNTLDDSLDDETMAEDVQVLSALGDETRYRIVRLLTEADDELCVCELTPMLDVSDSAVSHALSRLSEAGLVERRKEGRWRMYRATSRAHALLVALDGAR